ncbi:putative lipoprotein [Bacteriovorax sp. DB6_IX]|nr:putative lipoprotein [Bacteriovorax sp. DB6_IX]
MEGMQKAILLLSLLIGLLGCNSEIGFDLKDLSFEAVGISTVDGADMTEGSSKQFTISLSGEVSSDTTLNWEIKGLNPSSNFSANTGQVSVAKGESSVTINIQSTDDSIYEGTQNYEIVVSSGSEEKSHTFSVADNEAAPQFHFTTNSATVSEAVGSHIINATLDHPVAYDTVVDFSISGSAFSADHGLTSNSFTIPAGQTSYNWSVPIQNDYETEGVEVLNIEVVNVEANGLNIPIDTANKDYAITISANDTAPTPPTNFNLSHSGSADGSTNTQTVDITLSGGSAPAKICISETQVSKPVSSLEECVGGSGPDNGWHTSIPSTYDVSSGDGTKTVYVWTADADGVVSQTPITDTVTLDSTAPVVAITSPSSGSTVNAGNFNNFTVSGTCSEDITTVQYSATGGDAGTTTCSGGTYSFDIDYTSAANGAVSVDITHIDEAGNSGTETRSFTKSVVTSDPALSIKDQSSSSSAFTNSTNVNLDIVNDATVAKWCVSETQSAQPANTSTCAGSSWVSVKPTSWNFSAGEGSRSLYVWVADSGDTINPTAAQDSISLDTVNPTLSDTSATHTATMANHTAFTIQGSCSENGQPVKLSGDIVKNIACSGGSWSTVEDLSSFLNGTINITANLSDTAENAATSLPITITKSVYSADPTSLAASDSSANAGYAKSTSVDTLTIVDDASATKWCLSESQSSRPMSTSMCSGSAWVTSEPTTTILSGGDGTKTLYLWTADANDIISQNSASTTITLDTSLPTVAISTPASGDDILYGTYKSFSVSGTCSDDTQVVTVSNGSDTQTPSCTAGSFSTNLDFTAHLAQATVNLTFDHIDAAGNTATQKTVSVDMSVDIGNPTLSLNDDAPANTGYALDQNINLSIGADANATKWCVSESQATQPLGTGAGTCGGGNWLTVKPTTFTISAGDGVKTVYLWIADNDDNMSSTAISASIELDTVAPSLAISAPSAATVIDLTNHDSFTLSGTCSAVGTNIEFSNAITANTTCNVGGVWSYTSDMSAVANGSVTIDIDHKDIAGNSATQVSRTWTKNATMPDATISLDDQSSGSTTVSNSLTVDVVIGNDSNASKWCLSETQNTQPANTSTCAGSAWTTSRPTTHTFTAGEGSRSLYIWVAGPGDLINTGSSSASITIDTVAPVIAFTTAANAAVSSTGTLAGTCSEDGSVVISGDVVTKSVTCSGGTWSDSFDFSAQATGSVTVNINQTDAAQNVATQVSRNFNRVNLIHSLAADTIRSYDVDISYAVTSTTDLKTFKWAIAEGATAPSNCSSGSDFSNTNVTQNIYGLKSSTQYSLTICYINNSDAEVENTSVTFTTSFGNSAGTSLVCSGGGMVNTTCYVNDAQVFANNSTIYIPGNLVIQSGGILSTARTEAIDIDVVGNLTIESGGSISANLSMLSASTLDIQSGGEINVTNLGYAGSTAGGNGNGPSPGTGGALGNNGGGGGAGHAGTGGDGQGTAVGGSTIYGSLTSPVDFGSGAGGNSYGTDRNGGSGAGAVKIDVTSLIVDGTINAAGNNGYAGSNEAGGGGAGGSIWIQVDNSFSGTGTITVKGGESGHTYNKGGSGSGGRLAFYQESGTHSFSGSINVLGGSNKINGGTGTFYQNMGTAEICDSGDYATTCTISTVKNVASTTTFNFNNLTISGTGQLIIHGSDTSGSINTTGDLLISSGGQIKYEVPELKTSISVGGTLTVENSSVIRGNFSNISATTVDIKTGGLISADELGFERGEGCMAGGGDSPGLYQYGTSVGGGGGAHGGIGGNGTVSGGTTTYGSTTEPVTFGSGGGGACYNNINRLAGAGGGAIKITADSIINNGTISAVGGTGVSASSETSGGGAGGSIWLVATNNFSGNGSLNASGGSAGASNGGSGGGGRVSVKVVTASSSFTGTVNVAAGGVGNSGGSGTYNLAEIVYPQIDTIAPVIVQAGTSIPTVDANDGGDDFSGTPLALTYSCYYDSVIDGSVASTTLCTTLTGLTFNTSTGVLDWSTSVGDKDDYEFKVSATDGSFSDDEIFIVSLNDSNANIVLSTSANRNMDITNGVTPGSSVTLTATNGCTTTTGTLQTPVLTGDSSNFEIVTDNCTGVTLALNQSCTVVLRPIAYVDATYTANISISDGSITSNNSLLTGTASGIIPVSDTICTGGGTINTTCNINDVQAFSNNAVINIPGNLVLQSGGSLTTSSTEAITINVGGSMTIESGGSIVGNLKRLNADTLDIQSGGSINASSKGYAGGTSSSVHGLGQSGGTSHGDRAGGAGHASVGINSDASGGTVIYGSKESPVDYGSGGGYGNSRVGGAGGGIVRIDVNNLTVNGSISANAGNGSYAHNYKGSGGGSGGSIWITAKNSLSGNGPISAKGGYGGNKLGNGAGSGSGGRIAIHLENNKYDYDGTVDVSGGVGVRPADEGTFYLALSTIDQICDSGDFNLTCTISKVKRFGDSFSITKGNLIVDGTGGLIAEGKNTTFSINTTGDISILAGGSIQLTRYEQVIHPFDAGNVVIAGTLKGNLTDANFTSLDLQSGASITAASLGYIGGRLHTYTGSGTSPGIGHSSRAGGGAHASVGVNADSSGGTTPYGSKTAPVTFGSGGGNASYVYGGSGGGAIKISADTMILNGTLSANGGNGNYYNNYTGSGGGAGGSIWLNATNSITGSGTISANGGVAGNKLNNGGGSGSGGRIAIYQTNNTYGFVGSVTVSGGGGVRPALGGTFYLGLTSSNQLCDTGDLNTTCTISGTKSIGDNISIAGTGNLIIDATGGITGLGNETSLAINMTGDMTIAAGGSLTMQAKRNISNLVVDDLIINGSWTANLVNSTIQNFTLTGTMSANSLGWRGGTAEGNGEGPSPGLYDSDNDAGGGAHGGLGGDGDAGTGGSPTYGSDTAPVTWGSGGGAAVRYKGGHGGGALKVNVANTLNLNGTISANGGNASGGSSDQGGGGAGGSVWIIANSITGSGSVTANGGSGYSGAGGAGGGGRVYIDTYSLNYTGTITANGNTSGTNAGQNGTAIVSIDPNSLCDSGTLSTTCISSTAKIMNAINVPGTLIVQSALKMIGNNTLLDIDTNLTIESGGSIEPLSSREYLNIDVAGIVDIQAGGTITGNISSFLANSMTVAGDISANGLGHLGGEGTGTAPPQTYLESGGGAYGGAGGWSALDEPPGTTTYGSETNPVDFGSGGGYLDSTRGGSGGGAIKITVTNGLALTGNITANGSDGPSSGLGGGAGGSIWLSAGTMTGSGTASVTGGLGANNGGGTGGGSGGGGRIAVHTTSDYDFLGSLSALGGTSSSRRGQNGKPGTVYINVPNDAYCDSGNSTTACTISSSKTIGSITTSGDLTLSSSASIASGATITVGGNLTLTAGTILSAVDRELITINVAGDTDIQAGAQIKANIADFTSDNMILAGTIDATGIGHQPGGMRRAGEGPGGSTGAANGGRGGASYGSLGGIGQTSAAGRGSTYGSETNPTDFGSAGGSNSSNKGAAGGGAIKLTITNKLTFSGAVKVNGLSGVSATQGSASGSGGSILISTGEITGEGTLESYGGNGGYPNGGSGGAGRIALYVTDSSKVYDYGGHVDFINSDDGIEEGTFYLSLASNDTICDSGTLATTCTISSSKTLGSTYNFTGANVAINTSSNFNIYGSTAAISFNLTGTFNLGAGSSINSQAQELAQLHAGGDITLDGDIYVGLPDVYTTGSIFVNGVINTDGKGELAGSYNGDGKGTGYGGGGYSVAYAGSHGGLGGRSPSSTYGTAVSPNEKGSGGGSGNAGNGGSGGGRVKLVADVDINISGAISANGDPAEKSALGCGAGGSILIDAGGSCLGTANLSADGGSHTGANSSGGGGGRIHMSCPTNSWTGVMSVAGGNGYSSYDGDPGTIETSLIP